MATATGTGTGAETGVGFQTIGEIGGRLARPVRDSTSCGAALAVVTEGASGDGEDGRRWPRRLNTSPGARQSVNQINTNLGNDDRK